MEEAGETQAGAATKMMCCAESKRRSPFVKAGTMYLDVCKLHTSLGMGCSAGLAGVSKDWLARSDKI